MADLNEELRTLVEVTIDAVKEGIKVRLADGADGMTVLEETKAFLIEHVGYTPLQAANMTRLFVHAVGQEYGLDTYSARDLEQIKERIDRDFS